MSKEVKKENVQRWFDVYEAMKNAVPDDNKMLEVVRAAEFVIADCLAQSNVGTEIDDCVYQAIAKDIKRFAEYFKPIAEKFINEQG
jgi:hypothetical protein